eukprot:CAMPEP_0179033868 /NCGR_PEP_ID=MMETSP0796-20121207/12319_1 /TAXON_ID=73915 /ORGANISM="Pyrodinium bahamense, Strain pbaha01" /LENGTH=336 /DNA_ID=CAMNT_0020730127 /DNA_START=66 /DNA_END=1078 /DNA_ORIENTATION=+
MALEHISAAATMCPESTTSRKASVDQLHGSRLGVKERCEHCSHGRFSRFEEPRRGFKWQRVQHLRPLKELTQDFQQRQAVRFRPLEELTRDFERRRRGEQRAAAQAPSEAPSYDRWQLLGVLAAMGGVPVEARRAVAGIGTMRVPPPSDGEGGAVDAEARPAREPGAGAVGVEAPRERSASSASEQTLQANQMCKKLEDCPSTAASGSEPSEHASESGSGDCEDSWEAAGHGEADGSSLWPTRSGLYEGGRKDTQIVGVGGWDAWHLDQDWNFKKIGTRSKIDLTFRASALDVPNRGSGAARIGILVSFTPATHTLTASARLLGTGQTNRLLCQWV